MTSCSNTIGRLRYRVAPSCHSTSAGSMQIRASIGITWPIEAIKPSMSSPPAAPLSHNSSQFLPRRRQDLSALVLLVSTRAPRQQYWHLVQRSVTVFGHPSMYGQQ